MSKHHDRAWEKFTDMMADARSRVGDTFVPLALICLQATPDETSMDVQVELEKDQLVIWPASVPTELRGEVLLNAATPYFDGTVMRGRQLDS